jgi:hypothetical protein
MRKASKTTVSTAPGDNVSVSGSHYAITASVDGSEVSDSGGKHESITVADWFDAPDSHIGIIQSADGFSITDAGVDQLVQAMSAFSLPSYGHWHNAHGEDNAVAPVLAANWQHS